MSYQAIVVEVFLSSPEDVSPEREFVVQYANEWNRVRSRNTGCFISILTWENLVAPALNGSVQDAVSSQIGNAYDVYLSMMWTRFGTPTGVASSGTEEEFNRALERVRDGETVRIATLFKKSEIDPTSIDASQLVKVQEFKKHVSSLGAFYREFVDDNSLRSILTLLFEQIAGDKDKYGTFFLRSETDALPQRNLTHTQAVESHPRNDDEEDGLIEVGEEFVELSDLFVKKLQTITDAEEANTINVRECSELLNEITRFGTPDVVQVKPIVRKAANGMDSLALRYEELIESIESNAGRMAELINKDLNLRLDFENPLEAASSNLEAAKQMVKSIVDANSHIQELIKSTDTLPRLSSDVNRAKRRLSKARRRMSSIFISLQETLQNGIVLFEQTVAGRAAGSAAEMLDDARTLF